MSKHTPGPWRLHLDGRTILSNQSHPIAALSDPKHRQVCDGDGRVWTGNDGPLIAAAPELLKTLSAIASANPRTWDEEVQDQFREWAQNLARAAVAKATGGAP